MKALTAGTQMNAQSGPYTRKILNPSWMRTSEVIGTYFFSFYCTYVDLVLSVSDVEIFVDAPLVDI